MTITRIYQSNRLTETKRRQLAELAMRLGVLRSEVWRRFGSINGLVDSNVIRDQWLSEGRVFNVPARLWKQTLADTMDDIKAYREAAKVQVRKAISRKKQTDTATQKRWFGLLRSDEWTQDKYLCRLMRKHFKHGQTRVRNNISLDSGSYSWFRHKGRGWIAVQGLESGKRIAIPLNSTWPFSGNIRLMVSEHGVAVHVLAGEKRGTPCGTAVVGIDKGYTEAFVDSDGVHHGLGLGVLLSAQSDKNKVVYQRRNQLKAVSEKVSPAKRDRIRTNNLGRIKLDRRKRIHESRVQQLISVAVHKLVDKAGEIRTEDLTSVIRSTKPRSKDQKRRMSGWVKGILAASIESISRRRGASVRLVQSSYSSQECHNCGCLGVHSGGFLHCSICKAKYHDDENAAKVVKARPDDPEIGLFTPFQKVKTILLSRTALRLSSVQPGVELGHCGVNRPRITKPSRKQL